MNLGLSKFEVRPVRFEAVRSSLYLGSIQHLITFGKINFIYDKKIIGVELGKKRL